LFRIVGLQALATLTVALLAWPLGGANAAVSALLGGAACVVPNALFALRLAAAARRPQGAGAAVFFVGELLKVGSTIALLALIAWAWDGVVWAALVIAVIVALKSYLFALLLR